MEYPDKWAIVKITKDDAPVLYKVLAGYYGGYLGSNSWRMNSGIVSVDYEADYYHFNGESGSCYKCHHDDYGLNKATQECWDTIKKTPNVKVEMLPNPDFLHGDMKDSVEWRFDDDIAV